MEPNITPSQPQAPMPPQQAFAQAPKRRHPLVLVSIAVLLVVLAGGAYYAFTRSYRTQANPADFYKSMKDVASLIQSGASKDAIGKAVELAQNAPSASDQASAIRTQSYAYFTSGTTTAQVQAVRIMKDQYRRDQGIPTEQAKDISVLLEFITASREQQVFNAVFSEEFLPYRVGSNVNASIEQLAAYAYSLHPTTGAIFQLALPKAAALVDQNSTLTAAQKKENADAVIKFLTEAAAAYADESKSGSKDNIMLPLKYYYWMAFLWGDVAKVYPERLKDSEEAFQAGIKYYDATLDENGKHYPSLEVRMPILYHAYASTLYNVDKTGRAADIKSNLDKIIEMVNANPSLHETQYIAQIHRAAEGSNISTNGGGFRKLGRFYKPYADFLAKYGLKI